MSWNISNKNWEFYRSINCKASLLEVHVFVKELTFVSERAVVLAGEVEMDGVVKAAADAARPRIAARVVENFIFLLRTDTWHCEQIFHFRPKRLLPENNWFWSTTFCWFGLKCLNIPSYTTVKLTDNLHLNLSNDLCFAWRIRTL